MQKPFPLMTWIDEHRDLLKPPVGNKMIWEDREFIVMAVGGPNKRDDFHVNEGEEFFYQIEGTMTLRVRNENGSIEDMPIAAGEIFLLPPKVPHSPQRPENSVGIVIERKRLEHEKDGLQWYCSECSELLYEESFHLVNIEKQFAPVFERFYGTKENYTCSKCGNVNLRPQ